MSDHRLTAEDEQLLMLEWPSSDLHDADTTVIQIGTLRELLTEVRLAWRVRSAMGWQEWPPEKRSLAWEAAQDEMRREYDAENAKDPQ